MKIEKLPTYSNGKKQGNNAADILKKNLGKFGLVNVVDESIDLGIDMKVQVIENNKPVPLFFNVQCKGKDELAEDNWQEGYISVPIKISTVNFWRQQNDITILFVVDNETECCYWCNPFSQIETKVQNIQKQDTVSIRVPLNEYIDSSCDTCPNELVKCILLYMVKQLECVREYIDNFNEGISLAYKLDVETSVYLLKKINESAHDIITSYQQVCESVIQNISEQIKDACDFALQLEGIDPLIVRKYCRNGVRSDKGFGNNKSLDELTTEARKIIATFLENKDNTEILEELVRCDREMEELLRNIGAFLYEMAREENPEHDFSELYELTWNRKWRYYKANS